jgi:hypothetical protein
LASRTVVKIQGENGSGFAVAHLIAAAVLVAGCREPGTVIPDIPKAAESARAAAAAAAKAAEGPAPEPPPVLVEEAFKAEPPSGVCSISASTPCMFDGVVGGVAQDVTTVKREGTTALFGWAADGTTTSIPSVVIVELVGAAKKFYAAATRAKRPDVAIALKQPALIGSGYDLLASFRDVDPGEYGVQIVQITATGGGLTCDTRRKLKVE